MVGPNGIFDFCRVNRNECPCGSEIGGAQTGVVLKQFDIANPLPPSLFKHPNSNAGLADACLSTTNTRSPFYGYSCVTGLHK